MRLAPLLLAVAPLVAAGCVDSVRCHAPSPWPACTGETSEPGASGTPPSITSLMMPTCAYVSEPAVTGNLQVADPDGDAQTVKASLYVGPRLSESEVTLPASVTAPVPLTLVVPMASEGAYDVRVKVVDRAGGQSAPVCNTLTLFR